MTELEIHEPSGYQNFIGMTPSECFKNSRQDGTMHQKVQHAFECWIKVVNVFEAPKYCRKLLIHGI